MSMPHFGSRTEQHFIAVAPRQYTPFHVLPVEGGIDLRTIDETGKEVALEQRTAATGVGMSPHALVIAGRPVRYFDEAAGISNLGEAGLFTTPRGVLKINLRGNRKNRCASPLRNLDQRRGVDDHVAVQQINPSVLSGPNAERNSFDKPQRFRFEDPLDLKFLC